MPRNWREAARALRERHGIDERKAALGWANRTCYYCGGSVAAWTVPRILPLCEACGKDEAAHPILAEERRTWASATPQEWTAWLQ